MTTRCVVSAPCCSTSPGMVSFRCLVPQLMVANAAKLAALPIVTVVDFGFTRAPPDVVSAGPPELLTLFYSSLLEDASSCDFASGRSRCIRLTTNLTPSLPPVSTLSLCTFASQVHPYTVRGEDLETYSQKLDEQSDEALWTATQAYLQRHAKAVGRNPELAKGCRAVLDVGLAIEAAKASSVDTDAGTGSETT